MIESLWMGSVPNVHGVQRGFAIEGGLKQGFVVERGVSEQGLLQVFAAHEAVYRRLQMMRRMRAIQRILPPLPFVGDAASNTVPLRRGADVLNNGHREHIVLNRTGHDGQYWVLLLYGSGFCYRRAVYAERLET
ncbi:MAG: hypothetical protein LBE89_00550, partial [Helicobacteraceae bacterium]|nr:hypothetical protein [Helicobacteraceae bacterium]